MRKGLAKFLLIGLAALGMSCAQLPSASAADGQVLNIQHPVLSDSWSPLQGGGHVARWQSLWWAAPMYFDKDGKLLRTQGDPLPSEDQFVAQINTLHNGGKARSVSREQLQAEIAAARKKLADKAPAQAASEPGPLTVVAPQAEIDKLQGLAQQADQGVLSGSPQPQTP